MTWTRGPVASGVVSDNFTVLLLHCSEDPLAGNPIDYSSYARVPASITGFTYETTTYKFGGSAYAFGGGVIAYTDAAEFELGTSDFCFEGWFWPTLSVARMFLGGQCEASGLGTTTSFYVVRNADKTVSAGCNNGGTTIGECNSIGTMEEGAWMHVAYVRNGSSFTLYLDGVADGTASSSASVNNSIGQLSVGRFGSYTGDGGYVGYLDEIRMSIGTPRYTANFTPDGPFAF